MSGHIQVQYVVVCIQPEYHTGMTPWGSHPAVPVGALGSEQRPRDVDTDPLGHTERNEG